MSPPSKLPLLTFSAKFASSPTVQVRHAQSFESMRDLTHLLLSNTVLAPTASVGLFWGPNTRVKGSLGGAWPALSPLRLLDNNYLRLSVFRFLEETPAGRRLYRIPPRCDIVRSLHLSLRVEACYVEIRAGLSMHPTPLRPQAPKVRLKQTMHGIGAVIGRTFSDWYEDRAPRLGAALSYYTVFALAPSLVIVIGIAGLVLGRETAQGQVLEQIQDLMGAQGAQAVEEIIKNAQNPKASVTAIALGLMTLVFGLWGVFGELQDGLNTIWGVAPKPGRDIMGVLKDRFWSFALVVGVGFVLLVSLALSAWLNMLGTYFGHLLPLPTVLLEAINFAISLTVITVLFALTFKLLPDVKVAWRDVWLGAAVTSLLFTVGKLLIGLYLGRSGVASVFGAAGSLVVILVWVYYSAQILYLGAEFTKVWTRWRGGGFVADEKAIPVTVEARAEQGMG